MKKYYKDSARNINGKTAYKAHDKFEDGSSNWIIVNADGSTFATAYHDLPSQLWQVFRHGGQSVGSGRTIEAAIADTHDL
jgi:hypothetical protein